jgi:hypothetical protein
MKIKHTSYAFGWCEVHGKLLYDSRKRAREVARARHPSKHKSPYRCTNQPMFWHYGEVPPVVFSGQKTRDEVYGNVA